MRNRSGRTLALLLSLTLLLSISSSFFPTLTAAFGEPPVYSTPLGIALESYPYPYPVQYLPLEISGQPVRMAYMDVPPYGKGNGRVVMLLHGKNFYGSYWENTIKALSGAGYRVVVPDQIGFGKSAPAGHYLQFRSSGGQHGSAFGRTQGGQGRRGRSLDGRDARSAQRDRNYPDRTTYLVLENPIGLEDYRFKVPPQTQQQLTESEMKQSTESIRAYRKSYFVTWRPKQYERFVEVAARVMLSGEYPRYARASALTS